MAIILPFGGKTPDIAEDVFLAPNAVVIGNVRIEPGASIWFGAVLRGDDPEHPIVIGRESNVQDGAVVHVGDWGPTIVGPRVTVGHRAVFECCRIGEGSLIGMGAVILQEAIIGRECLIAAGAVVLEKAEIPDRSLVAGVPAKVRRTLDPATASTEEWLSRSWRHYHALSRQYLEEGVGHR